MKMLDPTPHWFALYENDYFISFKNANRGYEVALHVRKLRMELFWTSIYRLRYYILLEKGYEPAIWNFDQTPYYQNEAGAQNKPTLTV